MQELRSMASVVDFKGVICLETLWILKSLDIFCVVLFQERPDILVEDMIAMLVSLINLTFKVYPAHTDYVDKVLCSTVGLLQQRSINQ